MSRCTLAEPPDGALLIAEQLARGRSGICVELPELCVGLGFCPQGGCTLKVGGKPLKAVRIAFSQGLPLCRWNLPKSAKGKLLKGTISVTYGGSTAKKSFSGRVT